MRPLAAQLRLELALTLRNGESLLLTLGIPVGVLVFSGASLAGFGAADLPNSSVTTGVSVSVGVPVTLTATWTGLDVAQRGLGVISYTGQTANGHVSSGTVTILSIG